MKTIAIWCRNLNNIIGHQNDIPWRISSDFQRFKRITSHKTIIVGEKTYDSLPNRTLPNRKILILSLNPSLNLTDPSMHSVVTFDDLKTMDGYGYICGGGMIYKLFLEDETKRPDFVVDCVYNHSFDQHSPEEGYIYVTDPVAQLEQHYFKEYINEIDDVKTYIWIKKNLRESYKENPTYQELKEKAKGE